MESVQRPGMWRCSAPSRLSPGAGFQRSPMLSTCTFGTMWVLYISENVAVQGVLIQCSVGNELHFEAVISFCRISSIAPIGDQAQSLHSSCTPDLKESFCLHKNSFGVGTVSWDGLRVPLQLWKRIRMEQ